MEPKVIEFQFLQEITDNFSKGRIIGRDLHATVYMGVAGDGEEIAVKVLHDYEHGKRWAKDDLCNLAMLNHPNLVRFMGYCPHVPQGCAGKIEFDGETIAVCSEYLCNGSLQKHLSDEFSGFSWHTRYRIIMGICEGLNYIHEEFEHPRCYLDLKPDKILLDKNMVPKISILSLSECLRPNYAGITFLIDRTMKYYAPEYLQRSIVSDKADVFSLGVLMIEIVTGPMGYSKFADMPPQEFIDQAEQNWRIRLQETCGSSKVKFCCQQVKKCTEVALSCVNNDRHKRPNLREIIRLVKTGYVEQMEFDWQDKVVQGFKELSHDEYYSISRNNIYIQLNLLERTINGRQKPSKLQLSLLQYITKGFSDELQIGRGGCGVVYKGILPNGIVAVKRLFNSHTIEDMMFHREVKSMMMIHHPNTVRFLGYCSHTEEQATEMGGKHIMAQIRERLLCFEYIRNGSLENQITDELRGLEWQTRYQIIKGICEGLHHLHKEKHIIHMDVKPSNILLDNQMVPKITDFGLSRFDEQSKTMSAERLMSLGYCAPEYMHDGKMSAKSDIYSLGVIITELVTGSKDKPSINKVLRRWKHRWSKSAKYTHLGYKQVAKCVDLALSCKHTDPKVRPNIEDILSSLNEMDSNSVHINDTTECLELEDMLGIEPLEMHFPLELNEKISRFVELTNDTDDYFAFRISTTSLRPYSMEPNKDIVPPRSKCVVTITLEELEDVPPLNQGRDEFSVQSTRVDGSLTATDITGDMFSEHPNKVVDDVNLVVVLDVPQLPGDW